MRCIIHNLPRFIMCATFVTYHLKRDSLLQVLEHSKSSYLAPFLNLRSLIQHESVAAEDNVTFLLVLEAPCKVLAAASPEQIPTTLPRILHCVRLIWNLSRFYSVPDRITGLLRKVRLFWHWSGSVRNSRLPPSTMYSYPTLPC